MLFKSSQSYTFQTKQNYKMARDDFQRFLIELKDKSDIVDVVSHYLTLQRSGNAYKACCPFHSEKTPSFFVKPDGQFYKCFSCGESGDVIKFVQKYEDVEFMEAVEILAKRAGLKVPDNPQFGSSEELRKKKDRVLSLLKSAAKFYYLNLSGENGAKALEYLASRGLSKETIVKFGFGLSLDFDGLVNHLISEKYTYEEMMDAGVVAKNSKGGFFDSLYGRLIVPIINKNKDVIGFGGRALEKDYKGGKYKNTRETIVFDKSKSLFNANNVQKLKQDKNLDRIIIVEGYMDAIQLVQNGIENVVASMGTSLTIEQASMICHLSKNVFISYDGDGAGQSATIRGLDILANAGANVRVVELTDNLDPDDFVRRHGPDEYRRLVDEAIPLTDFKLKKLKHALRFDSKNQIERKQAKTEYVRRAVKLISQLPSPAEREEYLKLIQKETGITLDYLKREMESPSTNKVVTKEEVKKPKALVDREIKAIRLILASKLSNDGFDLQGFDISKSLQNKIYIDIYEYIQECERENRKPNVGSLFDIIDENGKDELGEIINLTLKTKEERQLIFLDCVKTLKTILINQRIEELSIEYQNENDISRRNVIAQMITDATKELSSIK